MGVARFIPYIGALLAAGSVAWAIWGNSAERASKTAERALEGTAKRSGDLLKELADKRKANQLGANGFDIQRVEAIMREDAKNLAGLDAIYGKGNNSSDRQKAQSGIMARLKDSSAERARLIKESVIPTEAPIKYTPIPEVPTTKTSGAAGGAASGANEYKSLTEALKQYVEQQDYANASGVRATEAMKKIQDIQAVLKDGTIGHGKSQVNLTEAMRGTLLEYEKQIVQGELLRMGVEDEEEARKHAIKSLMDQTAHEGKLLDIQAGQGKITKETAAVLHLLADARNRDLAISLENAAITKLEAQLKAEAASKNSLLTAEIERQIEKRKLNITVMEREGAQALERNLLLSGGEIDKNIENSREKSAKIELKVQQDIRDEMQKRLPISELERDMLEARNKVEDQFSELIRDNGAKQIETTILQLQGERALQAARGNTAGVATIDAALAQQESGLARIIAETNRLKTLQKELGAAAAQAAFTWTKALAPLGKSFETVFGKAGKSISGMIGAFAKLKDAQVLGGKAGAKATLDAYEDMAGAAKGFFKENSTGYKIMEGIEKALHVLQMGNMAVKLLTQTGVVSAKIAGDAASTASGTASSAAQGAADSALLLVKIALGIANQANGDPYSAFARIAAMAAVLAGVAAIAGVSFSGGGGGGGAVSASASRQKSQGTGTVLGDPDAKSNSLANALEMLADINLVTMRYSARMAASLRNIEVALTGVASLIFRTPGLTSGNMSGIAESSYTSGWGSTKGFSSEAFSGGLPGFKSKKVSVTDSGLTYKGPVSGIEDGLQSYTDVTTTKKSWWGLKKSTNTQTIMDDASDDISRQFGLIFKGISDSLVAAGGVFGKSADILETQIANIVIDLGMVSLKGLKGEELKDALNGVIGAAADDIAKQVLPGLEKFIKVGEGYYETAIRVAYSTEFATVTMGQLGMSLGATSEAAIVSAMNLVDLAGGIEGLQEIAGYFYENFFSDFERMTLAGQALNLAFGDLNLAVPKTSAEFRALIQAQDLTTEEGRSMTVSLLKLAPAFKDLISIFEELAASTKTMFADTREEMAMSVMSEEQKYNFLRDKATGLEELLKNSTDPVEIERLSKQINAISLQAWNLLGEEERKIKLKSFTKYLDDIEALTLQRLGIAKDVATTTPKTIPVTPEAKTATAADTMQTAASTIEAAGIMYRLAAAAMQAAADTPTKVDVNVDVSVDTPATAEVGYV